MSTSSGPDPIDRAVDQACAALRRVAKAAEAQEQWGLRDTAMQMFSDLLDAWEREE